MSKIVKKKDLDVLIESTMSKVGIKKPLIKEEYAGGVNYDTVIAAELKAEVGDLNKLTPYVLEKGDNVQSDSTGKIHVTDSETRKTKIFKNTADFLKGIGYQMKMESKSSKKPLIKEESLGNRYTKVLEKNFAGNWSTPQNDSNKAAVKNFFDKVKKGEANFSDYFDKDYTLIVSEKDFVNEFKPSGVTESKSSKKPLINEGIQKELNNFNKLINYTFKK